jgi:hypothetical protein
VELGNEGASTAGAEAGGGAGWAPLGGATWSRVDRATEATSSTHDRRKYRPMLQALGLEDR